MPPIPRNHTSRKLLLKFFLDFSRFEYALKAGGYFQHKRPNKDGEPPGANPDWNRFAKSLRDVFKIDQNAEVNEACSYILNNPPMKQVIVNDSTAWMSSIREEHEFDIAFLLRMVRCVRNNLFHGGKHNIELFEEIQRTESLLYNGLIILHECLRLAPQIKHEFDQAVI